MCVCHVYLINYLLTYLPRKTSELGCDHIGHRPHLPQPYRPQQDNIGHSKNHIGHTENQYRPKPYRPQRYRPQNIRRVYLASSWRYVSVSCSPYGEFERERNITSASLCTTNTPKYTLLVIHVPHVCVHRSHLLPGLPWGLNFNANIHPIPTEKPVGIPTSTESRNPPYSVPYTLCIFVWCIYHFIFCYVCHL